MHNWRMERAALFRLLTASVSAVSLAALFAFIAHNNFGLPRWQIREAAIAFAITITMVFIAKSLISRSR